MVNLYQSGAAYLVRLLLNILERRSSIKRVLNFFEHLASLLLNHRSISCKGSGLRIFRTMLIDHSSRVNIQVVVFVTHEGLVAFKLCIRLRYVSDEWILTTFRWVWHVFGIIVVIRNI